VAVADTGGVGGWMVEMLIGWKVELWRTVNSRAFYKGSRCTFLCFSSCVYISPNANNLNPFWITGFSDAESSFIVSIRKKKDTKLGWSVTPIFSISLNKKDLQILEKIQYFFGVGTITFNKKDDCYLFSVQSIKHIVNAIIPHFERNPLLTKKRIDFLLFKSAAELINAGEHLNLSGLQKIVNIRASLNKGLTDVFRKIISWYQTSTKTCLQTYGYT